MKAQKLMSGFTLMEMVIVIMLIGLLMAVAVPSYLYYASVARSTRLNAYATLMMTGARLANYTNVSLSLPASDLLVLGDGLAVFHWPKASYVCNLLNQQMTNGPDAAMGPTSVPISCSSGVLADSSNPSTCYATYHDAPSDGQTAYVDVTHATPGNC